MSARNPLLDDPKVSTRGQGYYGLRFVRFVVSGAPGGYSTVELVDMFPTREERDAYARKLRKEQGGSRKSGPIIETFDVEVPELAWFALVYGQAALIDDLGEHQYGMVRIYDTNPPICDVRFVQDEEELRWMLAAQWETDDFGATPGPDEPHAPYDVYYFAPDEPVHLFGVVEADDLPEDDEEADA